MKNIVVKGTIVSDDDKFIYDWLGFDATSPKDVRSGLTEANGDDVTVEVNSGGGDVFAGNDMYYALTEYKGRSVTVDITGFAASAATIVCCAGQRVRAVPGVEYMIHNVSSYGSGDHHDMDKMSEILQTANKSISNIYRIKTGLSNKELLELMDRETWMDADEAMKYGFIDEIINGDSGRADNRAPISIYNNASTAMVLSDEVKQRVREQLRKNPGEEKPEDIQKLRNELKLIRLRGGK